MKKILLMLALCFNMIVSGAVCGTETGRNNMKIKLSFDDKEVIVRRRRKNNGFFAAVVIE